LDSATALRISANTPAIIVVVRRGRASSGQVLARPVLSLVYWELR